MKFPNLRKLNLKDHKITSEQDEEVFLNILNNNKSLRFLEVDFDVEIQIYEMATKKKLNEDVMKKLLINGHSLIVKEPT